MSRREAVQRPSTGSRVVFAALVAFALWPLAQHVLVRHFGTNPWKLAGWAMYTVPAPPVTLHVVGVVGQEFELLSPDDLAPRTRAEWTAFARRRHALGRLTAPDGLADRILRDRPALDGVVVVVRRMSLDPETARMVEGRERYVYARARASG